MGIEIIKRRKRPGMAGYFIVEKNILAMDVSFRIERGHELKALQVSGESLDSNPNLWEKYCKNNDIIVVTAGWLKDKLEKDKLSTKTFLSNAHTIVLDEVHHALECKSNKGHPFHIISERLKTARKEYKGSFPRLIGLTASATRGNTEDSHRKDLEKFNDLFSEVYYFSSETCNVESRTMPHDVLGDELSTLLRNSRSKLNFLDDPPFKSDMSFGECEDLVKKYRSRDAISDRIRAQLGVLIEMLDLERLASASGFLAFETIKERIDWYAFKCRYHEIVIYSNILRSTQNNLDISPKLNELKKIMLKKDWKKIIVFVQTRTLAKALCRFAKQDAELGHLRIEMIVGSEGLSRAQMMHALQKFKLGDSNVLVSTSACEEGVDVSGCDRVILFDGVNSGRQLIQSKGRARNKKSKCIVFKVEGSDKLEKAMREEKLMNENLEKYNIS